MERAGALLSAGRAMRSPRVRLALLGAVLVAASVLVAIYGVPSQRELEAQVDRAGPLAPLAFFAFYVVATVALVPGSVITAAGGALFGVAAGTALTVGAATVGAVAAFVVGRRLGRREVRQIAGPRVQTVDAWLRRRGFVAVLYLRLIPLVPFNAFNYAAGVSGVRLRDYTLATAIGIVPGAFAFAALGGSLDDPTSPAFLGAVALIAVLAVGGPLVDRWVRRGRATPDD